MARNVAVTAIYEMRPVRVMSGKEAGGGQRGVHVVVQQPPGRGVWLGRVVRGGQGAGMLPEQVVEPVAAGCGLGDQVLVIEAFQAAASLARGGVIQRSGRVGVDVWPWVQAQRRNSLCWSSVRSL